MEKLELAIEKVKTAFPGLCLLENEAMAEHCSFKIGGPVRALALPGTEQELIELCRLLHEAGITPYILGKGTNILFPDEGLKNVFMISTEKLEDVRLADDGTIEAQVGASLARLASFARQYSLAGLEFASGIPGSVGGGLMMNAGAYGGELKDVVESVKLFYLPEQKIYEIKNADCAFGYRTSLFQQKGGCVLLSAKFRLPVGDLDEINRITRELNEKRRDKQPLDLPSAGSAFRRPVGGFAAALIEQAGLKGYSIGGAQVSEKHAGFVVNRGSATAEDVRALMAHIKKTVQENSGIELRAEMIMLSPELCPQEEKGAGSLI